MGCGVYYLLIMALNFPSSPTVGQTHDATNGLSYTYDGVKWKSAGTYDASTSGQQYTIDDISSDFNGTTKTFNLHHNSTDISLSSALDVTISVGGVIQEPDDAYTVNPAASTITFSAAPPDGVTFFGILKAKLADTNITVSDGTITNSKLSGNIALDKLANGTARQLLQSNSGGDAVEWTSNVDVPGTLDVTGAATFDSTVNVVGSATIRDDCTISADNKNFAVKTAGSVTKFLVDTDNGNTTISGTLGVTGATTFSDDVTFTGAATNIVWDKSQNQLEVNDNSKISIGTGGDLELYHDATDSFIKNNNGYLYLDSTTSAIRLISDSSWADGSMAAFHRNGSVDLYYDNVKKFETNADGTLTQGTMQVDGAEGSSAQIRIHADEGDDNADKWRIQASTDGSFYLENYTSGSYEVNIKATGNGNVELYHDNSKKLETVSGGATVTGALTADKVVYNKGAELTISSGAITVTNSYHEVDTEGDASSDDLATINGGVDGQLLLIRAANNARTVVVKDGTGNIYLHGSADYDLDHGSDTLHLMLIGSDWREIGRANIA